MRSEDESDNVLATVLGSGFFVSPNVFFTCNHVVNDRQAPHIDGDSYRLVGNTQEGPVIWDVSDVRLGVNLHSYPDSDFALLQCPKETQNPYVALDYGTTFEGRALGIAGYPLGRVGQLPNGELTYNQLIFRVAQGIVTACYLATVNDQHVALTEVPVLEVNFMFVPGNSGGPIFDTETGRVVAFVDYLNFPRIHEQVQQHRIQGTLPDGFPTHFVECIHAVYSWGIKMERARPQLEAMGIAL